MLLPIDSQAAMRQIYFDGAVPQGTRLETQGTQSLYPKC